MARLATRRRLRVLSNHVAREAKAIDPAVLDQVFAFAAQNIDGSPRAPGGAAPGGGPSHHGVVAGVLDALADPGVRAAVQHEMNLQAREADWLRRAWPWAVQSHQVPNISII